MQNCVKCSEYMIIILSHILAIRAPLDSLFADPCANEDIGLHTCNVTKVLVNRATGNNGLCYYHDGSLKLLRT